MTDDDQMIQASAEELALEEQQTNSWRCEMCGCTNNSPCPGGCAWVRPNLCSSCAPIDAVDDWFDPDHVDLLDLLTPHWSATPTVDPRSRTEPLCGSSPADTADSRLLRVCIGPLLVDIPVRVGEPDGDSEEIALGVRAWTRMRAYGLRRLGPGVWAMNPSLWIPGELHVFLVLCDVPEPAPFDVRRIVSP